MRETIQNANGKQFHAVSLSGGKDSTAMLLLISLYCSAVGWWYRPKPVSAYSGHWQISHADISEGTSILGSLQ